MHLKLHSPPVAVAFSTAPGGAELASGLAVPETGIMVALLMLVHGKHSASWVAPSLATHLLAGKYWLGPHADDCVQVLHARVPASR